MHLVLFDIDGTLLNSHGAGRRAMKIALEAVYGTAGDIDNYNMAGKTDRRIVFDLLTAAGLTPEDVEARFATYARVFARTLEEIVRERPPTALPGALPLVQRLARRPDVLLGLLTGNLPEGARIKLESAGFNLSLFRIAAFGSDALDRDHLPAIALRRARTQFGHTFQDKHIVIVGDTPLDIQCSRAVNAKSVAVATGPYPPNVLAQHRPDVLLPDLSDVEKAESAILNGFESRTGH